MQLLGHIFAKSILLRNDKLIPNEPNKVLS